jgi:NTE family protein
LRSDGTGLLNRRLNQFVGLVLRKSRDNKGAMRAFVLSGGGNRGPLEIGATKALLQAGIAPDMVVGTSAGAINGVYLALKPTVEQMDRCAQLWREAGKRNLFSASPSQAISRIMRGTDYLADNKRLRAYMREAVPQGIWKFGDLKLKFYVAIAHLLTHQLYFYGDEPNASIFDAVILSAAVPGFFPPQDYQGEVFTDGGIASNLALLLAISRGAREIYALDLASQTVPGKQVHGAMSISTYVGQHVLYRQTLRELELAMRVPGVTIHHIPLYSHQNIPLGDFTQVDGMLEAGYTEASAYLANPQPGVVRYPANIKRDEMPKAPPGARPFHPDEVLGMLAKT